MSLHDTPDLPPKRRRRNARPPARRVKLTNGSALVIGVDGRSSWTRRAKQFIDAHLSDLGGIDNTSAAERSLVRRCATLSVELERLEGKFALAGKADPADLDLYIRASGNLRRILESLGLQRRTKDVTPSLGDLLRADQHRGNGDVGR